MSKSKPNTRFTRSIGLLAAATISADGKVDPAEVARYLMACEDLGIPEEVADAGIGIGFERLDAGEDPMSLAIEAAESIPLSCRALAYEFMVHVAGADDRLAESEIAMLAGVADALDLSRAFTIGHMARFVRDRPRIAVPRAEGILSLQRV